MKIKQKILFLLLFSFAFLKAEAQKDSLNIPQTLNQVYVGVLGDDFLSSIFSLNYSRKFRENGFILFGGIGTPKKIKENSLHNSFVSYTFDAGFLFRQSHKSNGEFVYLKKYKRNTLWGSLSVSIATGKWYFITTHGSVIPPGGTVDSYYHDIDFVVTPGLSYQWQNKNEKIFCRLMIGMKLFSRLFSRKYQGDPQDALPFFPWIGISMGGAW
ncbi:MAG: hypothetical protein HY064_04650 [Bacteroidetes bacterium]|nr:hypothetical protein [Bacteroidota bacterium]